MSEQAIEVQDEGGVVRLTVNRPKALNALNSEVIAALAAALDDLEARGDLRAVLITGAGEKAFVAGADITEMRDKSAVEARDFAGQAQATLKRLEALPVPVVALVNGFCLGGGCELALACDWAVASDNAVFGQPEVLLGVIPGFGGTQRLPRRVGPAMALDLVTTGRKIDANEALRIGLVNRVMSQAELEDYAAELTKQLGGNGPQAVRGAKQAVHDGLDQDLDSALALETSLFALCFAGDEQREGMSAFVEKRKPNF
ncbi:enoyl-CoA hydratase-related protein [Halomonas salina]|uniref:Enoyl-CoA hydratase n=1 Tax=Halomonas salina TaxID=42565 RepID=A0ABR4WS89_9GAMM|nr:enoyl-CoA hydratase-related protein [Halomonas salina]KGE77596.1 enoyl-CoA hydratase [Halomonas salina]